MGFWQLVGAIIVAWVILLSGGAFVGVGVGIYVRRKFGRMD